MSRLHLPRRKRDGNLPNRALVDEAYASTGLEIVFDTVEVPPLSDEGTQSYIDDFFTNDDCVEVEGTGLSVDQLDTDYDVSLHNVETKGDTEMTEAVDYGQNEAVSNEATAAEARAWLQENASALPEGVAVGNRGRLSAAAREAFTNATGRPVK